MRKWLGPVLSAPATLWLLLAFLAPFLVVLVLAFQPEGEAFAPITTNLSLAQLRLIFDDPYYAGVFAKTIGLSAGVCAATTALAYPLACWIASLPPSWRPAAIAVVLIPLLVNVVVRSLGIELLLAPDGLINGALGLVGVRAPNLLYTYCAIGVGLVQVFLPYMVLALYDAVQSVSPRVLEAAQGLGASRPARFIGVLLPLSLPGLRAGLAYVFLMASTTYVSARMLGGKKAWTTGMLVWQEALENLNSPLASALALLMTVVAILAAVLIAMLIWRFTPWLRGRPSTPRALPSPLLSLVEAVGPTLNSAALALGLALLAGPLVLVLVQSVNDVPQATAAGFKGFTLRWYAQLFSSGLYLDSFMVSLELALATALVTAGLAAPAAFALVRTRFPGQGLLSGFWTLPVALPQVAIGIGMLHLLQTYSSLPAMLGLIAVHVTITLPFCIGLLRASVLQLDESLEEAAANLGAGPLTRIGLVLLPGLAPGLVAAGLVAFLLSFEEVTITSFLTTARLTTLPVRIYAEASYSLEPTVFAIATLLILMVALALALVGRLVRLDRLFAR